MTQVLTEAPALTLTADLGTVPTVGAVANYLDALNGLWTFATDIYPHGALEVPEPFRDPFAEPVPPMGVRSLKIASPLETVLVAVAAEARPFGYVLAAMFVVERGLKLLMAWQKHRAELLSKIAETERAKEAARAKKEEKENRPEHDPQQAYEDVAFGIDIINQLATERLSRYPHSQEAVGRRSA
jgi:hypothetical protein